MYVMQEKYLNLANTRIIMSASAGTIRPNKKAMKIAYSLLKTPKELQQKNEYRPSNKRLAEWFRDSLNSQ